MYPSITPIFWNFTKGLEGYVDGMYCDILNLVTTGCGNLIDPLPMAWGLPWLHRADDSPATTDEITEEWHTVKDGKIPAYKGLRPLYLKPAVIANLVLARFAQNEVYLARRWSNWDQWPADAQLGAHSCAWAAGPKWAAPKFDAAALALDFMTIAGPVGNPNISLEARGEAWLRDGPLG